MKAQNTYSNWDFINIWQIKSNINLGYPFVYISYPVPEESTPTKTYKLLGGGEIQDRQSIPIEIKPIVHYEDQINIYRG